MAIRDSAAPLLVIRRKRLLGNQQIRQNHALSTVDRSADFPNKGTVRKIRLPCDEEL